MKFMKKNSSYSICGVGGNVLDVCYRTNLKEWMNRKLMISWTKAPSTLSPLPNWRKRNVYVDNYAGNTLTPELHSSSEEINIEARIFPAKETNLLQPVNYFVIQKLKSARKKRWN